MSKNRKWIKNLFLFLLFISFTLTGVGIYYFWFRENTNTHPWNNSTKVQIKRKKDSKNFWPNKKEADFFPNLDPYQFYADVEILNNKPTITSKMLKNIIREVVLKTKIQDELQYEIIEWGSDILKIYFSYGKGNLKQGITYIFRLFLTED